MFFSDDSNLTETILATDFGCPETEKSCERDRKKRRNYLAGIVLFKKIVFIMRKNCYSISRPEFSPQDDFGETN